MIDILSGNEGEPYSTALFFDFDGTLVDIAERPDQVALSAGTRSALATLAQATGGAVAVVSGRPVAQLNAFLHPLRLPLAGVHGLEFQTSDGRLHHYRFDETLLDAFAAQATEFASAHEGLLVENKRGSVALHYRQRPDLEGAVRLFGKSLASGHSDLKVQFGKMVVELRLGGRSKADAVSFFMRHPLFEGRKPWFFGDDTTDEDGFDRVNELGGVSFKIGAGETAARHRFVDFDAFQQWLTAAAAAMEARAASRAVPDQFGGKSEGGNRSDQPPPMARARFGKPIWSMK